ncbi:hypothetical protein, partial [Agrobacterium pusense]|uniref:hypothetical protein n=1 Tax=Agrobacterium pusense TaxID=648995 RepID=UPI0032DB731A
ELRQSYCPKFDPAGENADFAKERNLRRAGPSHETVQVICRRDKNDERAAGGHRRRNPDH